MLAKILTAAARLIDRLSAPIAVDALAVTQEDLMHDLAYPGSASSRSPGRRRPSEIETLA